jgi:hypothetical protein
MSFDDRKYQREWSKRNKHKQKPISKEKDKVYQKKYYVKYHDRILQEERTYYETHREQDRKVQKKSSAKRKEIVRVRVRTLPRRYVNAKSYALRERELPWELTFDQYEKLILQSCYYCDKITLGVESGVGLDRIDNDKGYTIDNVLPCCTVCNQIRGDNLTVDEMKVAMEAVLRYRNKIHVE